MEHNDKGKLYLTYQWLVGILVAVLFVVVSAWATAQSNTVDRIASEHRVNEPRIATLEANFKNIIDRLERIEKKLDR